MHFCPQEMMAIAIAFDPAMAIFLNVTWSRLTDKLLSMIKK